MTEPDLLSELLAPLRLRGVFHSRWSARAPWGVDGDPEDCALLHYVREGGCAIELADGAEPVWLGPGELAVFPHGTAHRLGDRAGRTGVPLARLLPGRPSGEVRSVRIEGPGPRTLLLCGGLDYDAAAAAPLYRALPPVLVLRRAAVAAEPLLADTLRHLADADVQAGPGGRVAVLRAFETAFVLALRAVLIDATDDRAPLPALRHPAVGRALLAVHTRYAEPWTLTSLAAEAGLSRSAFAAAFRELVGEPPMTHLAARRMQEAAQLLTATDLPHSRIAAGVGYGSVAGFHLAFRSWTGSTPGAYRRSVRHPLPPGQPGPGEPAGGTAP